MSRFDELRIKAEVLEKLENELDTIIREETRDYRVVGESTEQDTHWRTGELIWEDDEQTIPKMKKIWDWVDIPEEEYTEEKKLKIKIVEDMKKKLDKLI